MRDDRRVRANLARRTYDSHVARHAAAWSATASIPTAQAPPVADTAGAPDLPAGVSAYASPRIPGPDVFFPSAASIPPVNIMTAEPTGREPETTGAAPARTPPRRPSQAAPKPAAPVHLDARGRPQSSVP
jgi:hypothetical protein